VEALVVKPHEVMAARTRELEDAFYGLLDVCDRYRRAAEELLAAERESTDPRPQLIHRLEQLLTRIGRIIQILEDDALTEMLPILDRLFALERAEPGIDI
jgi:hypothetical protein